MAFQFYEQYKTSKSKKISQLQRKTKGNNKSEIYTWNNFNKAQYRLQFVKEFLFHAFVGMTSLFSLIWIASMRHLH